MRVLVDGVVFGESSGGLRERWESLLRSLARDPELRIDLLDRGGSPAIDGVAVIEFPSYREAYTPADSQMIQRMASHQGSEAFLSTGWTTPTTTPSVAVLFGGALPPAAALGDRRLRECALAIRHASRVICADEPAAAALRDQLAPTAAQPVATIETVDRAEVADRVGAALRTAAATAPAAAEFYRRWAALRDMQAGVDG